MIKTAHDAGAGFLGRVTTTGTNTNPVVLANWVVDNTASSYFSASDLLGANQ
jgi:hypothetical protein